jgi:FlaA1/EpsC-like NDP-sugar epimerase
MMKAEHLHFHRGWGNFAGRLAIWMHDAALFGVLGSFVFLLRFEFYIPPYYLHHMVFAVAVWMVIKTAALAIGGLDRCHWRYVSLPDILAIARWNLAGSLLAAMIVFQVGPAGFPRSVPILEFLLSTLGVVASRMWARVADARTRRPAGANVPDRVLIYGAGFSGAMLLRELRDDPALGYDVCGFIDDDVSKRGSLLQRVPVLGGGEDLAPLVERLGVSLVFVAIPSSSAEEMTAILLRCRYARVRCKTMPGLAQLITGQQFYSQIRDVSMEDVLARNPVRLDEQHVLSRIEGEVVLVTGAAGSIGSELCRQLARFRPKRIVGFEIAETALFHLEQEMRTTFPAVNFHCAIGSIQNELGAATLERRTTGAESVSGAYRGGCGGRLGAGLWG